MIDIFDIKFWRESDHRRASGPFYISQILNKDDSSAVQNAKYSVLVLDPPYEEIIQGLFIILGVEMRVHIIRDGLMVRFKECTKYDTFYYPYNPSESVDLLLGSSTLVPPAA